MSKYTNGQEAAPSSVVQPAADAIKTLLHHYQAGQLDVAEQLACAMCQEFSENPFGWKALGTIRQQLGRFKEALEPLLVAARLLPSDAETHCNLGVVLKNLGRFSEAAAHYRDAILLDPNHVGAHNNLGNLLREHKKYPEAEALLRKAVSLNPGYVEAHNNLGNVLMELCRFGEAESSYREATRLKPDYAEGQSNLGHAIKELGRLDEAESRQRLALELKPEYVIAHNNLGNILRDLGRLADAEASYREAIRLKPDYAEAYSNLGSLLRERARLSEAEKCLRQCIALDPTIAQAHSNYGVVLKELGRLKDSLASYRVALRLMPELSEAHSNILFCMNYMEMDTDAEALQEARAYGASVSLRAHPKFNSWRVPGYGEKLRVGFVSGDFKNHPVGYFIEGLIPRLNNGYFETVAFPTSPISDDLTNRLKPHFSEWHPLYGKNNLDAAKCIHESAIQVLIDLSGHTALNRLPVFAYKPAPVQVSWLGYFATTGLPEMDYFLGDPYVSPEEEAANFTERIWRLPETWLCFTPPHTPHVIGPLPSLSNGFTTFGSFGNLSKMGDQVVRLWSQILKRAPGSKLYLKSKQLADSDTLRLTYERFAAEGIEPSSLILEGPSGRDQYFECYNRVDMILDTFPYPGGTTSVEALWMGVPVLTLKGHRFLSRLGESIAHNIGNPAWIAADEAGYVDKALHLSSNQRTLSDLRCTLRARALSSPLFDTQRFAANFGETVRSLYKSKTLAV